jgi:ankyrin repeat protein
MKIKPKTKYSTRKRIKQRHTRNKNAKRTNRRRTTKRTRKSRQKGKNITRSIKMRGGNGNLKNDNWWKMSQEETSDKIIEEIERSNEIPDDAFYFAILYKMPNNVIKNLVEKKTDIKNIKIDNKPIIHHLFENKDGYDDFVDVLEILVEAGANVNIDIGGKPIIEYLITEKREIKYFAYVLKTLVEAGANVNIDIDGKPIIYYMITEKREIKYFADVLKTLVEAGANVNDDDNQGPLIIKAITELWNDNFILSGVYYDIIELLVKNGANVKVLSSNNETPLHAILLLRGYRHTYTLLHDIIVLFLDKGVDVNSKTKDKRTAFSIFIENININIDMVPIYLTIELFFSKGALTDDINIKILNDINIERLNDEFNVSTNEYPFLNAATSKNIKYNETKYTIDNNEIQFNMSELNILNYKLNSNNENNIEPFLKWFFEKTKDERKKIWKSIDDEWPEKETKDSIYVKFVTSEFSQLLEIMKEEKEKLKNTTVKKKTVKKKNTVDHDMQQKLCNLTKSQIKNYYSKTTSKNMIDWQKTCCNGYTAKRDLNYGRNRDICASPKMLYRYMRFVK